MMKSSQKEEAKDVNEPVKSPMTAVTTVAPAIKHGAFTAPEIHLGRLSAAPAHHTHRLCTRRHTQACTDVRTHTGSGSTPEGGMGTLGNGSNSPLGLLGRREPGAEAQACFPRGRLLFPSDSTAPAHPRHPGPPGGALDVGQTLLNSHASSQTCSMGPGPQQAQDRGTDRGQSVAWTTEEDPEDLVHCLGPTRLSQKPGESGL